MDNIKIIANNRKAFHDYYVEEKYEAGIELAGTNLKDSWCSIVGGEVFVNAMHISPYDHGNIWSKDPMRVRKLLMHKREINKLFVQLQQKGYSLIPLSAYFKGSIVKLELGLCKGKKLYDKREAAARQSAKRDIERAMKSGTDR